MSKKIYMRSPRGAVFETSHPEYHKDCARLSIKEGYAARQEYCRKVLREMIQPNQTVYCVLRRVSKSGMSRDISLFIVIDGELRNIDVLAADACGIKLSKNSGIVMGGCGMDMGFALVYNLGCAIWPDGTPEPHGTRNDQPDNAGGYSLKHEWI